MTLIDFLSVVIAMIAFFDVGLIALYFILIPCEWMNEGKKNSR